MQAPRGYDPRSDERYAGGNYPPHGAGRPGRRDDYEGWNGNGPGEEFLPGFGNERGGDQRGDPGRGGPGRGGPGRGGGRRDRDDRGGPDGDWDDRGERRPRRGAVRRLAPWIAVLVILTPLVVGGWYGYSRYENRYHPADYSGPGTGPTVTVQVETGDSASSIGPELVSLGVVASSRAFVLAAENAAENNPNTAGLEPGFYKLNHHMQASLAYAALLNPKYRVQLTVTIPEGKRVSQVVALLAKDTSIPLAQFQQIIDHPAQLGLPSYANGKVEGYLFPATYQIQPNESALQILQAMVQRYDQEASQINLLTAATDMRLSPEQVIIEASMAQAEGGSVSDYPKIAEVINNRLAIGMKLQFDSVLLYGLNQYAVNVTDAQIATPGPYNDFEHAGLPPTPICNPGDAAIRGILHPDSGNWLYFLTVTGGKSQFSATPLSGQ
jgi:uncharacterized YceG family protein